MRLNPPWRPVTVTKPPRSLEVGSEVTVRLPLPIGGSIPWHLRHTHYVPGREFRDEQIRGPFRSWSHLHQFIPDGDRSTIAIDEISYSLPVYARPLAPLFTRELRRLFHFRHSRLAADLALQSRWAGHPRKRILIAGASGFIGSAIAAYLSTAGHTVYSLVRRPPRAPNERSWDPERGVLASSTFDDIDVVIHLGGESLLGRWSAEKKRRIVESRAVSTELLARAIATLERPPAVAIIASAIGAYGDTSDQVVDESAPYGSGFLAHVCREWERASSALDSTPCRRVTLRIGTVLNAAGGALRQMLPAFSLGLGGRLGSGAQYVSWIALEDLCGIIEHAIYTESLSGPVNAVSPTPCTNHAFTKTLGQALRRPTLCHLSAPVLRAIFGELADNLLLGSSRVHPTRLVASGYRFLLNELSEAIQFESGLS